VKEDDDLLEKAENLEALGLKNEALEVLRQASRQSDDPIVLTRLGALATDLELWLEAEEALQKAIELEPGFTLALFYLGLLYKDEGRFADAFKSLSKAATDEPSGNTFNVLGVIQIQLDLIDEAEASFRKAISLDPEHEEAYYNLATTLRNQNNDEAIRLLGKAIDIDPNYALAHREIGFLLRINERFLEAEYHLRRAIEIAPSDGWTYIYLGNLLWTTERFAEAESAFQKAVEVSPEQSVSYWSLAHYLEMTGRSLEARKLYQKAIEVDPSDLQANWRFANYLKNTGENETAKLYLRRLLELDPNDERAASTLAALSERHSEND
jgi:tetratricopeptide (TPR) repeat protein